MSTESELQHQSIERKSLKNTLSIRSGDSKKQPVEAYLRLHLKDLQEADLLMKFPVG